METTLNINIHVLGKIRNAALLRGINITGIIVLILKKTMDETSRSVKTGRLVQYQGRCSHHEWRRVHVRFEADEYEYFLDLRKLMKMSLSLILSIGIDKFLDSITKNKNTDNNRYINYLIINERIDSISCWRMIWGYPPSIVQHLRPEITT
jgi:hypothetical protein